jgi:polar amino acid transport system permease protein
MATAAQLHAPDGRTAGSWVFAIRPSVGEIVAVAVLAAVLTALGLSQTKVGGLFAPLLGTSILAHPDIANLAIGMLIAGAVWANLVLLRLMPFAVQVVVVWVELSLLFVAFIGSFDRDLGVWFQTSETGETNLAFLITTGAVTTLYISLVSILIASCLAMAAALGKLSSNGASYAAASFYISFFRGTPLLLQVYLIYIGLPQLGPQFALDAVPSGVIALSLCYGAYMAEIFRAGIIGVPNGQREAAEALGLPRALTFRKIVLPQAMRLIVPPTGNQFIAMLKDSALVSVMGVWELTKTAQIIGKRDFKVFEMLIAAALIYWVMSICFELIQSRIERHYGRGHARS